MTKQTVNGQLIAFVIPTFYCCFYISYIGRDVVQFVFSNIANYAPLTTVYKICLPIMAPSRKKINT